MESAVLAVSAIIVDERGWVLLIQRGHEPAQGLWSLPGGSVEHGESMTQALRREVREETGLEVEVREEVWVKTLELAPGRPYEIHSFRAVIRGGSVVASDDAADARFFPPGALDALATTPLLSEALRAGGWPSTA